MLIQLAGLTVDMQTRYGYTDAMCEKYRAPEGAIPDFSVSCTDEEILREQPAGMDYPIAYLESLAIYRKISREALAYQTFLFHGSVLEMDGEGYLFTAPSGTGKSTHARLWREVFGDRVTMINDDKPFLTVKKDGLYASGTPWDGKHRLSTNKTVKLRAICFLERGEHNRIRPLTRGESYGKLLLQTNRPKDPVGMQATLLLLDRAAERMSFWQMSCNMDPEAATVAYQAMKGK